MKKIVLLILLATSLTVSARALIVGVEAGYLTDAKEEYISARLGYPFRIDEPTTHEVDLEIGFSSQKESGIKGDFTPITINYRIERDDSAHLSYYFGLGLGVAVTKVSGLGVSDDNSSMAAQAFTGAIYHATPNVNLTLGVKYIWIDDVKLLNTKVDLGDDVALTAGVSLKF